MLTAGIKTQAHKTGNLKLQCSLGPCPGPPRRKARRALAMAIGCRALVEKRSEATPLRIFRHELKPLGAKFINIFNFNVGPRFVRSRSCCREASRSAPPANASRHPPRPGVGFEVGDSRESSPLTWGFLCPRRTDKTGCLAPWLEGA